MKTYAFISVCLLAFFVQNVKADVVARWNFDEGTGTTVNDSAGTDNDYGTISGSTWSWTNDSVSGKALHLGGGDMIAIHYWGDPTEITPSAQMALGAWVKPDQNCANNQWGYAVLIHRALGDRDSGYYGYDLGMTNSRFDAVLGLNGAYVDLNADYSFPTDRYTRIGLTYDGNTMALWVGNDMVASKQATGDISHASTSLHLGGLEYSYYQPDFTGSIDEFMIGNLASDYVVPEPCTLALLGFGMILTMVTKRKERTLKMKPRVYILAVVLFLVVPNLAYAGPEFPVCTNSADQIWPAISGNIVVWEDRRNEFYANIYGKNLSGGSEFSICINNTGQYRPAISGNIVVWYDLRNKNDDIYGKDLSSSNEFPICTNSVGQSNPAISGNIVVWEDRRNGYYSNIYGKNLSTSAEFPVSNYGADQQYPQIGGNIVVWQDYRNVWSHDIYGKDLSTGSEFSICADSADQLFPVISGNIVVWQDYRMGNYDIYGYNLTTGEEFPVCTNTANQMRPSISGQRIVWQDYRNGNWDIFMYDLGTKQEIQLTDVLQDGGIPFPMPIGEDRYPVIDGDTIVWQRNLIGNEDIYAIVVPEPSTLLLLASGLLLLVRKRRKQNGQAQGACPLVLSI